MSRKDMPKTFKVLFIGNSYSENTAALMPNMAKIFDFKKIEICYLYKGGCSLDEHWNNMKQQSPEYKYCRVQPAIKTLNKIKILSEKISIQDAVKDKKWDWIVLQQTSRTSGKASSYNQLPRLIQMIKSHLQDKNHTKFAFNMTWAYHSKYDKLKNFYNGSQKKMYEDTCAAVQLVVEKNPDIDLIIPAGTAIQNIRINCPMLMEYTCDYTHLNANGAYVASLTAILAFWTYYNSLVLLYFLHDDIYHPKSKYVFTQHRRKFKLNNTFTKNYKDAAVAAIFNNYRVTEV